MLIVCFAVSGCREDAEPQANLTNMQISTLPKPQDQAAKGWGAKILSLVPDRNSIALPSASTVKSTFRACALRGIDKLEGRCNLDAEAAVEGAPAVRIAIFLSEEGAKALHLQACCSDDDEFFKPIAGQAVLRSELFCSELTITASESVQAFRVTAPGKRDFLYSRQEQGLPEGRAIIQKVLLTAVEPGDECSALANT
ncbi:hypothetical protein H9L13_10870 [Sphingomonas lutea]|uniref:Uncharacterized protein n=1 Tax=Sphingomonas lutea TaxID=1045317 RepID=A0A7G9SGZ4_9SPHN|nr:hypothetical protein [Sphingomonas lutea]QNN67119.1 hypothetical protein H9L13_10870 [Sphingomonas lutea]